jgi:hypothetical protein
MIRDENAVLTGYVYLDLNTRDYGGFVSRADKLVREKLQLPAGYSLKWSGENEFELRAKERLKIMLPIVFVTIFLLLYMVFRGGRGLQSSRPSTCPRVSTHRTTAQRALAVLVASVAVRPLAGQMSSGRVRQRIAQT